MSVCRKLPDGTIQKIAGHTILLDANASEIRQGTWYLRKDSAGTMTTDITFTDPMPDTDYVVILEPSNQFNWDEQNPGPIGISNKTTTGFTLSCYAFGPVYIFGGKYTAFKPVKIEGYTELQNKINNPDDTPTIDSMNLVTSDGVARAIENASAVWKGTRAEWNALPAADKVKYDLAVLLDQTLVKAIDRTDGTETSVADLSGQFVGTHAEWEAETNKTQYKTAVLTDDRKTVNEVTSTGELNEVADDARIWRGTKAEWEALSTAEKDKWDQAEIETIEAQGLNPFRTLSDPETLSIAPNTDYTCPHDGFICAQSPAGNDITTYINGQIYGQDTDTPPTRSVHTIPVCKGDVFKYALSAGVTGAVIRARWYTTDINPGNPIDYPVVHRSQSLDWDNKVAISNEELVAGWTAPGDGYFCTTSLPATSGDLLINGILISRGVHTNVYWTAHHVQIPVVRGDVFKSTVPLYNWSDTTSWFVPYKDYPDYSTTEHWTGRRWIDGKKIYSKVLPFTGNPSSIGTIPGVDYVVDIDGTVLNTSNNWHPLGGHSINGYFAWVSGENVSISSGTSSPFVKGSVTVEYTKTTD